MLCALCFEHTASVCKLHLGEWATIKQRAQTPLQAGADRARISFTLRVPKGFLYNSPQAHSAEHKNNNEGLGTVEVGDTEGCPALLGLHGLGTELTGAAGCSPGVSLTLPLSASVSRPVQWLTVRPLVGEMT